MRKLREICLRNREELFWIKVGRKQTGEPMAIKQDQSDV